MASDTPTSAGVARGDRIPPHSEDAERSVLGAILLDGERVPDLCIQSGLIPESFYLPAHRLIYEQLLEMVKTPLRAIDLTTVTEKLRVAGVLERVGGAITLDRLIDSTPTAAHAQYYIDIVKQKFLLRSIIHCARDAENKCYATEESAESLLGDIEQSFFDVTENQKHLVRPWKEIIKDMISHLDHVVTTHQAVAGLQTGYKDLDKSILGLRPNNLIILAARPSMGKTSLAMNIVENIAKVSRRNPQPQAVGVFSLEMSCDDLVMRMICSSAGVSSHTVSGGYLTDANHRKLVEAANQLNNAPIYLDDSAGLDILDLRARARRMKKKHDVQLIVIDYLQLLRSKDDARQGRQLEVSAVCAGLKAMSKELKVPVLVLSQLNRAPEGRDGIPKLSDLRDSGSIEQDADIVLMLRRPCKIPEDKEHDDRTLAIVEIAKNRNGPAGNSVRMNFIDELTRFEDRREGGDVADLEAEEALEGEA